MRFYIHKLGCPKNDVDGDYIAGRLVADGHIPVKTPEEADTVLVNTCGFIEAAKEESIGEILRLSELKKEGRLQSIFATGCLSQRYGTEMLTDMPELDGAFGHGALESIAAAVGGKGTDRKAIRMEPRKLAYLSWKDRFISDGYPYAYLKISDGCDRPCTYCAIPGMRGRFRSRTVESIMTEAKFLAENGKKELILVSQEATLYGYDLPGKPDIVSLLKELETIEQVRWIRLLYLYPAMLETPVIKYLGSGTKTLPYFDLPFQHASTSVLERMRRRVDQDKIDQLIHDIRSAAPDATLRTTFIVGFPGETEAEFEELRQYVERHRFDRMGVFTYSAEEGTPAASMPNQISMEVMLDRQDQLMMIQQEIAIEKNESLRGARLEILIDRIEGESAYGRTRGDCPDIDQEVILPANGLKPGDFTMVTIEQVEGYDLIGKVIAA